MYSKTLLVTLLISVSGAYAGNRNEAGKIIITNRGDRVTMSKPEERPVNVANVTECKIIETKPVPILLNDELIHNLTDIVLPDSVNWDEVKKWSDQYTRINNALETAIQDIKPKLEKGEYSFKATNMVVSTTGNAVYFETQGISRYRNGEKMHSNKTPLEIPDDLYVVLNRQITAAIYNIKFQPVSISGNPVVYLSSYDFTFSIR